MLQEINEEMVFKQSMTRELNKIDSLALMGSRLTTLVNGGSILRRMTGLKELNLTNNKLMVVNPLNELKQL